MNEERREKSRLRASKWRAENPEKSREVNRRWREANPEKFRESVLKWREKNREKLSAYNKKWRLEHAEEQKARVREWQENNAERKRKTDAAWREAHRGEIRRKSLDRYYRLKGVSPEERPVRDEAGIEAWRAEFARRWAELADRLGPEGLLLRLAALMRKERRRCD